jgi:hypothetical protein
VYALQNDFHTRSLDIVAAFLIGKGNPLYVRAPIEWHDLFLERLETLNPQERAWYKSASREFISAWMEIFMEEGQQDRCTAMSSKRFCAHG